MTIAKGPGAGYQPIGSMLCANHIYETIAQGCGFFQHGHTYLGHPVATATAAGVAVVREILERDLIVELCKRGRFFEAELKKHLGQRTHIGDIRGRGLFWGLEFVADKDAKTPFDPSLGIAAKLKTAAFDNGLICYPMLGTRAGKIGDRVLLAPPYIATEQELAEAVEMLNCAIETVMPE